MSRERRVLRTPGRARRSSSPGFLVVLSGERLLFEAVNTLVAGVLIPAFQFSFAGPVPELTLRAAWIAAFDGRALRSGGLMRQLAAVLTLLGEEEGPSASSYGRIGRMLGAWLALERSPDPVTLARKTATRGELGRILVPVRGFVLEVDRRLRAAEALEPRSQVSRILGCLPPWAKPIVVTSLPTVFVRRSLASLPGAPKVSRVFRGWAGSGAETIAAWAGIARSLDEAERGNPPRFERGRIAVIGDSIADRQLAQVLCARFLPVWDADSGHEWLALEDGLNAVLGIASTPAVSLDLSCGQAGDPPQADATTDP